MSPAGLSLRTPSDELRQVHVGVWCLGTREQEVRGGGTTASLPDLRSEEGGKKSLLSLSLSLSLSPSEIESSLVITPTETSWLPPLWGLPHFVDRNQE